MSKIVIKKKHHLLWNAITKEILVDFETNNPKTVTECWRSGIEGMGFDTKEEKEAKISADCLKYKNDDLVDQDQQGEQ